MVKVIMILSMKQLTPRKVKWKLRRKGADLDKKKKVAWEDDKIFALIDA